MKNKKEITTKKELMQVLKIIPYNSKEQRNSIVCSLIGHSCISTKCWGYRYCGRCGVQLGDNLCNIDSGATDAVVIGHNCSLCKENYRKCTWKDKIYTPYPFSKK
jgi:hypothetical protein